MKTKLPADVVRYGTDSSGRPVLMTRFMRAWWRRVCAVLGFTPTIVQGAFMILAGGGAKASAGYHDFAGCLDIRTRDLTPAQITKLVRVLRLYGAAAWVRDAEHGGMDAHLHFVLGADVGTIYPGSVWQWTEYLAGRDGLSSMGRDYHWRPNPIIKTPPLPTVELRKRLRAAAQEARKVQLPGLAKTLTAKAKSVRR